MRHTTAIAFLSLLLLLPGCALPEGAYTNRGDPENLLSVATDVVHITIQNQDDVEDMADTIDRETPVRAIVDCDPSNKYCKRAKNALVSNLIPIATAESGDGVSLVYEKTMARDCEQRYINNASNPRNINMLQLGCSVAGNTVQMVSDKKQFTNPSLVDFQDGEKAAQAYDKYLQPAASDSSSSGSALSGSSLIGSSGSSSSSQ